MVERIAVTSKDVRANRLLEVFPEVYALRGIVETNPWHNNQDAFDHTVSVVVSLEHLLSLSFLARREQGALAVVLSQEVAGGYSRKGVLMLVALSHDIGKKETINRSPDGRTACPGHERVGSRKAMDMLRRAGVPEQVVKRVGHLVAHHGLIHEVVNGIVEGGDPAKQFLQVSQLAGDAYPELLLQGYADMLGSNLGAVNPDAQALREEIFTRELSRVAASL